MTDILEPKNLKSEIVKSFTKKYAIAVSVLLVATSLWLIFFYLPLQRKLGQTSNNLENWNNKLKEASLSEEMVNELTEKVEQLKAEVADIENRLFYLEDIPIIADQLVKYAQSHDLRTVAMTPNYEILTELKESTSPRKPLVKLPLELKLVGRFKSVGEFISNVDKLSFVFAPDGFKMQANPRIYPDIDATVTGFLFLLNEKRSNDTSDAGVKKPVKESKG